MVAQVVPALALPRRTPFFDYTVPPALAAHLHPGLVVRIPFRQRTVLGVVWKLLSTSSVPARKLRPLAVPDPTAYVFREPQRQFVQWLADRAGVAPGLIVKSTVRSPRDLAAYPRWPAEAPPVSHRVDVIVFDREADGHALLADLLDRATGPVAILIPERAALAGLRPILPQATAVWDGTASLAGRQTALRQLARAPVIIGTRSLLTAPLPPLTSLVLWAEDNPHHDQVDQQPRFAGFPVARELARRFACPLVAFASAPTLTAYAATHDGGRWQHRVAPATPRITLWSDGPRGRRTLPHGLLQLVRQTLTRGERTLVFLNRRGIAQRLRCPDCGWLARCERCSAATVLHDQRLRCHACGAERAAPAACPHCRNAQLATSLPGTAGLERELAVRFPGAVRRLDRDAPTPSAAPIVVGTEFAFPHLPAIAPQTVVVLGLDAAFAAPTPRALERAFQLLRRLAAVDTVQTLAVVTRQPGHPLVQTFARGDVNAFYRGEWAVREQLGLPPAVPAIAFESRGPQPDQAGLRRWLTDAAVPPGALEGPVSTRRGRRSVVRFRLRGEPATRAAAALTDLPESWIIDPDPQD